MAKRKEIWLTTDNNPFDPFEQSDRWLDFDVRMGYNTNAYIMKRAHTGKTMTDWENQTLIDAAINDILDLDMPVVGTDGVPVRYRMAIEGQCVKW